MARKRGRALRQAQANAELRYGPQERALGALVAQARNDLKMDRQLVAGQAASTIHGARQSRQQLHKVYSQAASGLQVAQDDVEKAFGTAGVGADNPFALASDRESSAFRQRLTSAAANARKDTVNLEGQARLGKLFGFQQARQKFMDTRSQIQEQARQLGDERSVYTLSELGKSQEAAANRRNQRNVAKIQQGIDPKTGKPIPGGKADKPPKPKFDPANRSEGRLFTTDFSLALDYAKEYKGQNTARQDAARTLRRGVSSNQSKGITRVPQIRNQLALSVGLDMAYNGFVTRKNVAKLRAAGIRVKDVPGAISEGEWTKRARKQQLTAAQKRAKQYQQGQVY